MTIGRLIIEAAGARNEQEAELKRGAEHLAVAMGRAKWV